MNLDIFRAIEEEKRKEPELNIALFGYSPTIPCFPQLKDIWNIIQDQYRIEKDILILPEKIFEEVATYCEINKNKFPQPWYTYQNSIISHKPYILKPFKGYLPEGDLSLKNIEITTEELKKLSDYEQRVFAYRLMANPLRDYKKPIILGTAEDIQSISMLMGTGDEILESHNIMPNPPGFIKEDYIWLELDENRESILGEYKWQSN